jgi:tRNA-dihydrouridine synthase A
MITYPITTAPMMQRTDRHCRFLFRLCNPKAILYTEMITTQTMLHRPNHQTLHFSPEEHPIVLQLGGSDPKQLAQCAKRAQDLGFDGINLNVGCPSDRVQQGMIGACLMRHPELVATCYDAMKQATDLPITVKTRIGLDQDQEPHLLEHLLIHLDQVGCQHIILHARTAWLDGLSPKQNRTVPPLNYDRVYATKKQAPYRHITINGGLNTPDATLNHLNHVDAVMLGRAAYQNPWLLRELHQAMHPDEQLPNREETLQHYLEYAKTQRDNQVPTGILVAPCMNLMHGRPNAKEYKHKIRSFFNY